MSEERLYVVGIVEPMVWVRGRPKDIDKATDLARTWAKHDFGTMTVYELVPRVRIRRRADGVIDEIAVGEES